jgi:hypothetical protein
MVVVSSASAVYAERGGVSVEVGSGVSLVNVRAPYAVGAPSQTGSSFTTSVGIRYAITNALEVGASAFYQPPTTFTHGGAGAAPGGALQGVLLERTAKWALRRCPFRAWVPWRFVAGPTSVWPSGPSRASTTTT